LRSEEDTGTGHLLSDLQAILETVHGSNAQSIAVRIIASREAQLNVLQLMDDRQELMEAAKKEAALIGSKQQRQKKRWENYEYSTVHGWFVRTIGSWGTGDTQFRDPCGVAVAPNGDFWVADRGNHRIHHFDHGCKPLRVIGFRGKIEGQLENPSGIAAHPDGTRVYVADRGNDRVAVFNLDGACLSLIGSGTGKAPGFLQGPCGVAIGKNGDVAVCDYGNNRIQIFDAKGDCVTTYGASSAVSDARQRLLQPSAVCYTREGQVVVADYGNQRVVVFGADGMVCLEIKGKHAEGVDGFNGPSAVGVCSNGDIVVADQSNHRFQIFTAKGEFVRALGAKGHEPGRFHNPRGLAVGPNNLIAVADFGNHRISLAEFAER